MSFNEDQKSRIRPGFAAQNLAVIRHLALNLLELEPILKWGITVKCNRAEWDNCYLKKLLGLVVSTR